MFDLSKSPGLSPKVTIIIDILGKGRNDAKATLTEYSMCKRNGDTQDGKDKLPGLHKNFNRDNAKSSERLENPRPLVQTKAQNNGMFIKKYTENCHMKLPSRPPSIQAGEGRDDEYQMNPVFNSQIQIYTQKGRRSISQEKMMYSGAEGPRTNKSMQNYTRIRQFPNVLTAATPVRKTRRITNSKKGCRSNTKLVQADTIPNCKESDPNKSNSSITRIKQIAEQMGFQIPRSLSQPRHKSMTRIRQTEKRFQSQKQRLYKSISTFNLTFREPKQVAKISQGTWQEPRKVHSQSWQEKEDCRGKFK